MDIKNVKKCDVLGFEGLYEIDTNGNVYNKITGKLKKHSVCKKGYVRVNLWKNNKQKMLLVHRLVMLNFNKVSEKPTVNHIDSNKKNNRLSNLEWATYKRNESHKREFYGNDYHGTGNPMSKLDDIQVLTIRTFKVNLIKPNTTRRNSTVKLLKEKYNINQSTLYNITHGKSYVKLPFLKQGSLKWT